MELRDIDLGAIRMAKIIVVGAGIIGASAAYQLQKNGAQVTIIDAGGVNATAASFGWINASFFANKNHFELRLEGIKAFKRLQKVQRIPVDWSGCLCWENVGDAFEAQMSELKDLGYDVQEIDGQDFKRREPHVANPPNRCLYFAGEAVAESPQLAQTLLDAAIENGAKLISGVQVQGFETKGERVVGVQTPVGRFVADEVVLCAGTATQQLADTLDIDIPMLQRPALVIKTRSVAPAIKHVLVSEIGEVRQLPDGSILMPAAVGHQGDSATEIADAPDKLAEDAMDRLRKLLPSLELELAQTTLAHRPVPGDGLPAVGAVRPGLYVATLHSGITLGALMGELIASEVIDGSSAQTDKWLGTYRPHRFW